jgi:hypothetical protein
VFKLHGEKVENMAKIYMNELELWTALGYISCNVEGLASLRDGSGGKRNALLQSDGSKASWLDIQKARESLLKKIMAHLPEDKPRANHPQRTQRVRKPRVARKKKR